MPIKMEAMVISRGIGIANLLLCAEDISHRPFLAGIATVVAGLFVLAGGLLFASAASRRTRLGDPQNTNPTYVYVAVVLMIIAGCFLLTFGVALIGIFVTAC
ncbi:MAG: hypothetical protein ABI999_03315 [Acidobacteriota bacterium]